MLPITVLLVEDEANLNRLIQKVLTAHGYEVLSARDASEALRAWDAADHKIPVALVDLALPGSLDGMELAKKLLVDEPTLRLIITSGRLLWPEPDNLGCADVLFLQKPFLPHELLRTVRRALQIQEAESQTGPEN